MNTVRIYFNQLSGTSTFVYLLMGLTYVFLGISFWTNGFLLLGITFISIAVVSIGIILFNRHPKFSLSQFIEINPTHILVNDSMFSKEKAYDLTRVKNLHLDTSKLTFEYQHKPVRISLSGLNNNEIRFIKQAIDSFNSEGLLK